MRKQLLYCLAALCIIAAFVISCDSTPVHVHVSDDGVVTTEATCTKDGEKTYSCKECGAVMKTEKIAALGHDMQQPSVTKAATCTETGTRASKCSRCSETVTEEIAALGHDFADPEVVPATCTTAGSRTGKCNRCNETTTETIPALGHDYGDEYESDKDKHWIECSRCRNKKEDTEGNHTEKTKTSATCTKAGTKTTYCPTCGYEIKTENDAATGHTEQEKEDTKYLKDKATCTTVAVYYKSCSVCGEALKETFNGTAKGHTPADVVEDKYKKSDATCTASAVYYRSCSVCKEKLTDTFEWGGSLGHAAPESVVDDKYLKSEATCTVPKTYYQSCSRCHEALSATFTSGDELDHNLQPANKGVAATCEKGGMSDYQQCSRCDFHTTATPTDKLGHLIAHHEAKDATCTEIGWNAYDTCDREGCSYTTYGGDIDKLPHDYENGTVVAKVAGTCSKVGSVTRKCKNCDATETEETSTVSANHTYNETFSHDGTYHWIECSGCKTVKEGTKVEHSLTETTTATCTQAGTKTVKCSICDYSVTSDDAAKEHAYDKTSWKYDGTDHWHECTECGAKTDVVSHDSEVSTKNATCTEDGATTTTCKICKWTQTVVIKAGHSFKEEWKYDDTYHWHECSGCNEKGSYAEHSYTVVVVDATEDKEGSRTYTCTCGKTYSETIPRKTWKSDGTQHWHESDGSRTDTADHTYANDGKYTITQSATCTVPGTKTRTCTTCGYVDTATIEATGHSYAKTYDNTGHWDECSSCGDKKDKTAHTLTDSTTATCTTAGTKTSVCSCGYSISVSDPAKGHKVQSVASDAYLKSKATCTSAAVYYKSCSVCNEKLTGEETFTDGEPSGHATVKHEAKAPTCTEKGWDAYVTCSKCDYSTYVEKAALDHDMKYSDSTPPTCTEAGSDNYGCSRCGYTTSVEKAALGHDIVKYDKKDPTCTESGYEAYEKCKRTGCTYTTYKELAALGHSYSTAWTTTDASTHWKACTVCGTKSEEGLHDWDDGVIKLQENSCDGRKFYTCKTCKTTKEENVYNQHVYKNYKCERCGIWGRGPSGGYVFYDCDADNDSTNNGAGPDGLKSSECGWRFLEAAPADISDSNNDVTPIFGYYIPDGQTVSQSVGMTGDGIGEGKTNTEELVFAMGTKGENAWTESQSDNSGATTTEEYAALLCYDYKYTNTETNETFDDWFLPSIEELKLIMANLNKIGLGNYSNGNYWSSTEVDSTSGSNKVKIVYTQGYKADATENNLTKASTNGEARVRPIRAFSLCSDGTPNHTWNTGVTTTATCTERGKITYTCTKCNATKVEAIKELDHNWDEGKVTEPATCTNKGIKTYTCLNCPETKTEEIPVDPSYHPYENYKCKDCGIWGKGPSGGYVFYDCDADNDSGNADGLTSSECGWRFLEAAPSDAVVDIDGTSTSSFIFGFYAKEVEASLSNAGTETGIGTGLANTEKLVKAMGRNALVYSNFTGAAGKSDTTSYYAAKIALDYTMTNNSVEYNDWFLPSKEELETLISNIGLCKNKAGETVKLDSSLDPLYQTLHWSSSEDTASTATGNSAYYVQLYSNSSSTITFSRGSKYYIRPIRAFSLCKDGESEHKWEVTSTKAATCTENGTKTYKCSVCSATKTETLVALGHKYENYKCTICGAWGRGPAGGWVFYDAGSDQTTTYTDMNGNKKTYTWRYLEAAPEDCSYTKDGKTYYEYAFGYYRENASTVPSSGSGENLIVVTATDVGSGRNNTGLLMSKMGSSSTHDDAYVSFVSSSSGTKQYVRGASAAGATYWDYYGNKRYIVTNPVTQVSYTDWFLPSRDELALMSHNLRENDLGNLRNGEVYWSSSEVDADNAYAVYFSEGFNDYTTPDTKTRAFDFRVRAVRAFTDTVSSST